MPVVDEKGNPVAGSGLSPEAEAAYAGGPGGLAESAIGTLGRVATRAGAMTAGEEVGGLLGAMSPIPGGAAGGAIIGGGLGNIAGSNLPEQIGGDKEPWWKAFLWGAGPAAAVRGGEAAISKWWLKRSAESAHEDLVAGLQKEPNAAQDAARISAALGRPNLKPPPIATGEQLTQQTSQVRDSILGSLNGQRRTLGEPIGAAYETLKGNGQKLSESAASEVADAAQGVRDELIAPAPKAMALFNKIKRWRPPPTPESTNPSDAFFRNESTGEIIVKRKLESSDIDWMVTNNFTPNQIAKLLEQSKAYEPPTLDELREVRQVVNTKLRTAQGGDVHGLLGLQQAIDTHLMQYLPPDISQMRASYAGWINRFPWRDINRIRAMGTPRELADYVFGGTPERAHEIIGGMIQPSQSSKPFGALTDARWAAARSDLRESLIDRAMRGVDPNMPPDQQVKAIHDALKPHIAHGTAHLLFGPDEEDVLTTAIYSPIHRVAYADIISRPEQKNAFVAGWTNAVKTGNPDKLHAAQMGMERLYNTLPPEEQAMFIRPMAGAAPVLPETEGSLMAGALPGKSKMTPYLGRRAAFSAPYAGSRMLIGGGGAAYGAATGIAVATMIAGSAGYRAIMENGGASMLARLYASPNGRVAAQMTFDMLANMGAQYIHHTMNKNGNNGGAEAPTP